MDPYIGGALIKGGFDVFNSLFGRDYGREQMELQRELNRQNIYMQQETNALAESMFNKDLAWQRESQQIQNQANWEYWKKAFNMSNEYNSPAAQMQRAVAAGLNPMSVGGSNPVIAGNNSSPNAGVGAGGVGVPSLTAPRNDMSMQTKDMLNLQAKGMQVGQLGTLTEAVANVAKAGLSSMQEKQIKDTLQSTIDKIVAETSLLDEQSMAQNIENSLRSYFGFKSEDAALNLKLQQISESITRAELNGKQGRLFDAESEYKNALKLLTGEDIKVRQEDVRNIAKYWYQRLENMRQDYRTSRSEESLNYSSVDFNRSRQRLNDSLSQLNENENAFQQQTLQARIMSAFEDLSQNEIMTDAQRVQLQTITSEMQQAAYANDMKKLTYWINAGLNLVNTAANAVSSVKGFGFAPVSSKSTFEGSTKVNHQNRTTKTVKGVRYDSQRRKYNVEWSSEGYDDVPPYLNDWLNN